MSFIINVFVILMIIVIIVVSALAILDGEIIKQRKKFEKEAIEKGLAYYHHQTGEFTWKKQGQGE